MDLSSIDLAVLAAVGREQVRGEASDWWYVGKRDPVLSASSIEPQTRVTGRMRRLMRAGAVPVVEPPSSGRILAETTKYGDALLAARRPAVAPC